MLRLEQIGHKSIYCITIHLYWPACAKSTLDLNMYRQLFKAATVLLVLCLISTHSNADTAITIDSDGWQLQGDLAVPDSPVAFAILLHKAAGDRSAYDEMARVLAEKSIASIRLDLRGHGESINLGSFDPTLGRYLDPDDKRIVRNFDLIRAGDKDILSLMGWLEDQEEFTDLPLVVIGSSYTGQEMVEAARESRFADVYVALAPGSFDTESIAAVDPSGVPWLFVRAEVELPFFPGLFNAIGEGAKSAEIWTLPGEGHATDLFEHNTGLEHRLADWINNKLRLEQVSQANHLAGFASGGTDIDDLPFENVRRLRLAGQLDKAAATARDYIDSDDSSVAQEHQMRLELATIYDRQSLHDGTRPSEMALGELRLIESKASALSAEIKAGLDYGFARYFYRAEMPDREFEIAEKYVTQALDAYKSLGDIYGQAEAVHLQGLIEMQRGNYESARVLFDESLRLDELAGARVFFRGEYDRHMGFVLYFEGKLEEALPYFRHSAEARKTAGATDPLIFANITLASVLNQLGNDHEALPIAKDAITSAREIGSKVAQMRAQTVIDRIESAE
jgi:tetratricopeptide (TPR) repeat protein